MMSSSLKINPRRRTFVRLLGDIQHALNEALEQENKKRGLTRAEIARVIGRNRSFVTRKLNGTGNMTLETLADIAFALGRPVRVSLPERIDRPGASHVEVPAVLNPRPIGQQQTAGIHSTISTQESAGAIIAIAQPKPLAGNAIGALGEAASQMQMTPRDPQNQYDLRQPWQSIATS